MLWQITARVHVHVNRELSNVYWLASACGLVEQNVLYFGRQILRWCLPLTIRGRAWALHNRPRIKVAGNNRFLLMDLDDSPWLYDCTDNSLQFLMIVNIQCLGGLKLLLANLFISVLLASDSDIKIATIGLPLRWIQSSIRGFLCLFEKQWKTLENSVA